MRFSYTALLLLALTACDQNGGILPIDGQKLLSSFDGPKIPTMQDNQIEAAKAAEKNDDFAGASQIYQQILEKDQNNKEVAQYYADSLRRNGEYEKAVGIYDSILSKDPGNLAAKEGKGLALMAKGDFETPTALFDEVVKADGTRWKSLNGIGILFVTRGLYQDGMKYFEEALKQSQGNISVMNNLGLSQALNKQYETAIDTLSKASSQSAVNSTSRKRIELNLALVYASAGKLSEARKIAESYLSGPSLNNNLGLYAHLAKDDGLAKSYLNMALTESKTYYGKAWDNLEAINSETSDKASDKTITNDASKEKAKEEPKDKNKKGKKGKAPAKETGKVTIIQEPVATKSEVKPVDVLRDIKQENVQPQSDNKPNNKSTVSDVIDGMARDANSKPAKPTANILGTIKDSDSVAPAAEQNKDIPGKM